MNNPIDFFKSSLSVLTKPYPSVAWVVLCFLINLAFSILVALLLVHYFKLDIAKRKKSFFCLLVGVGAFIPFWGSMMNIFVVVLLRKYGKDFQPIEIDVYPQVEYSRKNPINIVAYGFSWASVRLGSSKYSQEERTQALQSVSKGLPRETNLVYSKLVSDEVEELRICAFSMLEIQQDFLQTKINQLLKKFEGMGNSHKRGYVAKQIALLYWELVYRNLSDQEFRLILLERSAHYAEFALEFLPEDTTLLILLARIDIAQKKDKEGHEALISASKFQISKSKILPYLAELAFHQKDYQAVRNYLSSDRSLKYVFKISKIIHFWCPE